MELLKRMLMDCERMLQECRGVGATREEESSSSVVVMCLNKISIALESLNKISIALERSGN